ncbi:MAG: cysteine transporter [Ruminococcaceae bacterium]|nr:cysteine transporter [Oscillospiraceae bacterium]
MIVSIWGICCGYFCVQMLCTVALYGLNSILAPALSVLKYIGSVYMVWLAIHIMRSQPTLDEQYGKPSFREGFLLQLVNVKIYFYITTLLSAYLIPNIHSFYGLLLAGVGVVAFGSIACLSWAGLGMSLQTVYTKHFKTINVIMGLFLLYCAYGIMRS